MSETTLMAIAAGVLSAAALPLGAGIGLVTKPTARFTSALMAFGAGALLFALSVEIVAESLEHSGFLPLAIGALLGAVIFESLNRLFSAQGGFLRKAAVAARYLTREKWREADSLLARLASVKLLQALPPEDVARLVPALKPMTLEPGQELFREGDAGSSLYLIEDGEIEVMRGGGRVAMLAAGETVGEIALITGAPRTATIVARAPSHVLQLPKNAFDELLVASPELRRRVQELVLMRTEELKQHLLATGDEAEEWQQRATTRLHDELRATRDDVHDAAVARGAGAAKGIWLGNVLDSIPESLVLGTTVTATAVSWPLLAGIFMANFPEALSSGALMRASGMSRTRVIWMWGSIVPLAAVCAAIGHVFLADLPPHLFGLIEGTAVGAMLVMIAQTMLPEAYERGGTVVGISTLLGFLAALAMKSIG